MLMNWPAGYSALIISLSSGFFGAAFFILAQLQIRISEGELEDVRDMWTWSLIFLRCLVGIGGAFVLYFFFQSGLLEGAIWPTVELIGFVQVADIDGELNNYLANFGLDRIIVPNDHLSLLIIWSFLAGYSQTFVPNMLQKAEAKI